MSCGEGYFLLPVGKRDFDDQAMNLPLSQLSPGRIGGPCISCIKESSLLLVFHKISHGRNGMVHFIRE